MNNNKLLRVIKYSRDHGEPVVSTSGVHCKIIIRVRRYTYRVANSDIAAGRIAGAILPLPSGRGLGSFASSAGAGSDVGCLLRGGGKASGGGCPGGAWARGLTIYRVNPAESPNLWSNTDNAKTEIEARKARVAAVAIGRTAIHRIVEPRTTA
jgi:hypothetical protein